MDWYRRWLEYRRDLLRACLKERERSEIMEHVSFRSKSTLRKHLDGSLNYGLIVENERGKYLTTRDGEFAKKLLNEILIRVDGLEDLFEERRD